MKAGTVFLILTMAAAVPVFAGRPQAAKTNACQVLTQNDLAAVQGEAFADTKLTDRGATSQCFYQLPDFVKSVSLDLTRAGGRDFWREHFAEEREERGEREREEAEEREEKRPPMRVKGVGDEAYWVGSRMAGSLYVLKGDSMLRVSVGGPGTEPEKIAKSKPLAKRALKRI
jgi:hypothetical protein